LTRETLARDRFVFREAMHGSTDACVLARRRFSITQATDRNLACEVLESGMTTLLFTCPNTGSRVQGWVADDGSEAGGDVYEGVTCLACRQVHMVYRQTGKVLGADEE
jgi:hypothetical protein